MLQIFFKKTLVCIFYFQARYGLLEEEKSLHPKYLTNLWAPFAHGVINRTVWMDVSAHWVRGSVTSSHSVYHTYIIIFGLVTFLAYTTGGTFKY